RAGALYARRIFTSGREARSTLAAETGSGWSTSATRFSASRRAETRLMTCIASSSRAISMLAILSGHSYNSAIIWQPRRAPIVWTSSRGLATWPARYRRPEGSSAGGTDRAGYSKGEHQSARHPRQRPRACPDAAHGPVLRHYTRSLGRDGGGLTTSAVPE